MAYSENEVYEIIVFALAERDRYWKNKIKRILKNKNIKDTKELLNELIK